MKQYFNLQNLFLFAIIVVLPVCVAFYSLNNMIEEQYNATRELISHDLKQQVANIETTSSTIYQIKDFFTSLLDDKKICRQKPEVIKDFIEKTDKNYPNAFKWIFLDENFNDLKINSRCILQTSLKLWKICLKGGLYFYYINTGFQPDGYQPVIKEYHDKRALFQKLTGDTAKPEHIFENKNSVILTKWLGKKCYIIWNEDALTYTQFKTSKEIAGLFVLLVFPEYLPENIWYKRLVVRRKTSYDKYKFPIATINITNNKGFELDSELPKDEAFVSGLIDTYNKRTNELFEYKNYLIGTTVAKEESEIRILSLADMSNALRKKTNMQIMLLITCIFLVITTVSITIYLKSIKFIGISLRQRIATIFLIAMIIPLISLISIGKIFIAHEEGRLKESAYVKMRNGLEALSMHYKDTPRLIENDTYEKIKSNFNKPPYTIESVLAGLKKSIDDGIIQEYIFFKDEKIHTTSWKNITPLMEKTFQLMGNKIAELEEGTNIKKDSNSNVKKYVDSELSDYIDNITSDNFDLSRPSHLRHTVFNDIHRYFMSLKCVIDDKICPIIVYLSDDLIEQNFAKREFIANNLAAQELSKSLIVPELSFYTTLPGAEKYPQESPIWTNLKDVLDRSQKLKIEETGIVNIENENFLYLVKPLFSMNTQSYLPCLLTSTKPIEKRIRDVGILLFALSAFALLGSILLSFALSSSLLVPIKKIDSAAQQVGKGNLDVVLQEEGNDELGRLSVTFNEMVKGLREREKMEAYVSDSVLEAVKDNSDQSVHIGKNIETTILFSDIRNFTGLSESNTPDKVFEVLNEFLGGVEPIIRINHGRVDKFIGDAVMAIFHHTSPEHHALSAIKAAVKIKEFVSIMNKERTQKGLFPIEIGIGISTGQVLLGDVGSKHRKDLTVIGDEVNLASRLENASKQGHHTKIIFSGQTLKIIENYVEAEKMPFEEIRGKKNAVQIYEFIKFKNSPKEV